MKEFYQIIVDAQKSDAEGDQVKAFSQYLDGIGSLVNYLKEETKIDSVDSSNVDVQLINGVVTLRHCIDRLHEICHLSTSKNNHEQAIEKNTEVKIGNNNIKLKLETSSNYSSLSSSLLPLSPTPTSSTAIEKAYKENALLIKIFNNRLQTIKDPIKRSSLQLELQRRLTENIQLAKAKDYEKYHEQHLKERKSLEDAAKKLFQQQHVFNMIDKNSDSSVSVEHKQLLYAQILQYETRLSPGSVQQFRCKSLNVDSKVINDIVLNIICFKDHPLCKWMKKFHNQMQNRIESLLSDYFKNKSIREEQNFFDNKTRLLNIDDINESDNELIIDKLESQALERHFDNITSEFSSVHETITLMLTLIMFDNEQYYVSTNRDMLQQQNFLIHSIVSDYLYPPVWCLLNNLFRIVYHSQEQEIRKAMQETYLFNDLQSEWANIDPKVIEEASQSLKSIIPLQSPYSKLKSMVRLMKRLCSKLKDNRISAEIGADELVPILCLVTLKSASPQLISECYAIEQLVDSKYLLGEEGYCLSSIQTSLKYIEMNCKNKS